MKTVMNKIVSTGNMTMKEHKATKKLSTDTMIAMTLSTGASAPIQSVYRER